MNWYGQPPQGGDSISPPLWGIVWTSYWTQRQVLLAKRKLYLNPCHVLRWATPAKERTSPQVNGEKLFPPSHTHAHPVIPMDNHHHLYEKNAILVVHYLKTDPHEGVPKHSQFVPQNRSYHFDLSMSKPCTYYGQGKHGKTIVGWWFEPLLKNHGVRQLGWWNSQVNGKFHKTGSKPPTCHQLATNQIEIPTFWLGKL